MSLVIIRQQPGQCRDRNTGKGWGCLPGGLCPSPTPLACECCFSPCPTPTPAAAERKEGRQVLSNMVCSLNALH